MKIVLVTGASSGFGALLVKNLLLSKCRVLAVLRGGGGRGRQLFSTHIDSIESGDLSFFDADFTQPDSLAKLIVDLKPFVEEGLDVLINNAGVGVLGPVELQADDQIRNQFEVNFFAPLKMIQSLLPALRKRKGKIINISSLVGFTVFPFYGTYAASKHALDGLSEALFYELRDFGVQVCAVEPGGYKTKFSGNAAYIHGNSVERELYKGRIKRSEKFFEMVQNKMEKDPQIVVREIVALIKARRIPVRKQIGPETHLNWCMKKILPDQLRIHLQDWIYRKFFF